MLLEQIIVTIYILLSRMVFPMSHFQSTTLTALIRHVDSEVVPEKPCEVK